MVSLEQLKAFAMLAETLSFSRAAVRLNMSQPALSKKIRLLEEELQASLFLRNRRVVLLSPIGRAVLEDAQNLLSAADDFGYRVKSLSSGETGRVRLGFVASATQDIIPRLTLALRRRFPKAEVQLVNLPTVTQITRLREHALDLGIVRLPLQEPGIETYPLSSEPFAIVYAKDHPTLGRRTATVRDLRLQSFVAYSERLAPQFFQHWTGLCRRAGYTPRVGQEVGEMQTCMALVSAGAGVAILPLGMTRNYNRLLKIIPLRNEQVRSELGLATLKTNPSPIARQLVTIALSKLTPSVTR